MQNKETRGKQRKQGERKPSGPQGRGDKRQRGAGRCPQPDSRGRSGFTVRRRHGRDNGAALGVCVSPERGVCVPIAGWVCSPGPACDPLTGLVCPLNGVCVTAELDVCDPSLDVRDPLTGCL